MPLEPLRALPGYGLVALTFFSYSVCDNDPYDEVSVAVVIRRPGATGSHTLELIDSMRRRSFFAHVLALPVTTEIARVRGVHGYQLPAARRHRREPRRHCLRTHCRPGRAAGPEPERADARADERRVAVAHGHVDDDQLHRRRMAPDTVQTNALSFAQRLLPRNVELVRHGGPLSQLLDGLGASTILRLDVVKDAQLVLNLPTPMKAFDEPGKPR